MWNDEIQGQQIPDPLPTEIISPLPLPVSGTVTAQVPEPLTVHVDNDPLEVDISATGTNTNPIKVEGQVTLGGTPIPVVEQNLPLPVTGSITVTPPANQNVTVTNTPLPVQGSVAISNTPISTTTTGSVSVTNLPATQNVNVTNPTTSPVPTAAQGTTAVSGSVDASGSSVTVDNLPLGSTSGTYVDVAPVPGSAMAINNFASMAALDQHVDLSNTGTNANPINVQGNLTVTPPANQNVTVINTSADPVPITGSITVTPPASQDVVVTNTPLPVSGTFWQATQPVSGSIAVNNFPATQPVSGSVLVSNFPATQPISGSVGVNNFPATQAVTGTFWQATQPISGTVGVSGTVATLTQVSNFPATQNVAVTSPVATSGGVAVDLTNSGTNVNPLNVSSIPMQNQPPPPGGTLINSFAQANWTTAGTSNTQPVNLLAGPGAGSSQRQVVVALMISGFLGQPSTVGWVIQFRNNAGAYNPMMWGYEDVYLMFPSPYWTLPANLTNQGVRIVCTNYAGITGTGGMTCSAYIYGWYNAAGT